ncbi:MAG TPA: DUF3047 domain-containing protein [Burkholderiaceae bacterium]|nr:DUF3047 domain-containing protein [Burkholderiaceae bacterium]
MKLHRVALAAASIGLAAVDTALAVDGPNLLANFAAGLGEPSSPWRVVGLPMQTKPLTRFRVINHEGARVLEVKADESYGNLVHDLTGTASNAGTLSWRWRIEVDNPAGDPRKRSGDDHALAVCAMFDLPLSAVPFTERQALRAARVASGEPLPSATLCYTWDERQPQNTVLESPFTRRVRYMVLRGAGEPLQQWRQEQRDLRADFLRLFGGEASAVPPLLAVSVSADADNTHGHSVGLLSELVLQ